MKNFLLLFLLLPLPGAAQKFADLIREYEKYCAEMVQDTIEQDGTITYELVPVMNNERIEYYHYGKADTTWSKLECPEFKDSDVRLHGTILRWADRVIQLPSPEFKPQKNITRKHVCLVKRREVAPFSEDFWEWVKKRNK